MPGYDARMVEPLKTTLICPECSLVLRDAVQTGDGVRLCESCYEQIYQYPNHISPKSGTTVGEEYHTDRAVRRELLQLLVLCVHRNYGCPWTGKLQQFEGHCQDCKYKPMGCPNPGCNELMPAGKLDRHVDEECEFRMVACDYCRQGTTANQLEEHQNRCPKVPVECERCSEWVVRDELEEHQLRDCPLVKCPVCEKTERYNWCPEVPVECERRSERVLRDEDVPRSHVEEYGPPAQELLQLTGYTDPVNEQDMGQRTTQVVSSCQPLHPHNPDILSRSQQGNGQPTAQAVIGFRHLHPENPDALNVLRRRLPNVEQSPQSQQTASGGLKDVNGSGFGETRIMELVEELFRQQTALEKRTAELETHTAELETHTAELEMQLQASLASTHNGSFLWRIPDVSRRKQDAIDGRITSIYSPPFYTGRNGYKMCVRAYLNGDGSGHTTHLSLFFVLMKGEYDALLKWPFDYKVSIILVGQNRQKHIVQTFKPTPESSSFQRPQTEMNVASGCPQFANLSVLYDNDYVKDDVLYIKCIVDTSRIFHP